jgi:HlyD family secretion protein
MRERNLNAQADLDAAIAAEADAVAQVGVTRATMQQARASLSIAQANLDYSTIRAPVDGIVLSRAVDVGATVAASFSAPTLFVIVDDLSRVQVIGNVDESEVGKLHQDMAVSVTVDAFPDDTFRGRITQLRFSSVVTQGVVTYPAVIDVENPEHKLRPGMTATLTVTTSHVTGTLRVPNGALRFQPKDQPRPRTTGPRSLHDGVVWVLDGTGPTAQLRSVHVVTGITDGRYTQIRSGALTAGNVIVLDDGGTAGTGAAGTAGGGAGGGRSGGGSKRSPPRVF